MPHLYLDFSAMLAIATGVTGLIWLLDVCFFKSKRVARLPLGERADRAPEPKLVEYAKAFFPILLIVFILRSFLVEPYRIPTGSMKPTLLEGDFILVNKFVYGVRLPLFGTKVFHTQEPKRGDILVFRYPNEPSVNYIKRVIGVPGDKIRYEDKKLTVNGQLMPQSYLGMAIDTDPDGRSWNVQHFNENLGSLTHELYTHAGVMSPAEEETVPPGMYFVMGDNRDKSGDSRLWGFVPEHLILGKAFFIWLSWDPVAKDIRWGRMGHPVH
ncbi:MAG: signal peptidase I [Candidatus Berkiellales bacterium]